MLEPLPAAQTHPEIRNNNARSTYQASMCKLMEYCLSPAIGALQDRLKENEVRLAMLADEGKKLEALRSSEASMVSPRSSPRGSAALGQKDLYSATDSSGLRSSGTGSRRRAS